MTERATCGRGWAVRCGESKSPRCTCACGGRNHGNAQVRARAAADETSQRTRTPLSVFSGAPERRFLASAGDEDIVLWREKEELEDGIGRTVRVGGIERRFVVHSPDGFEWGYAGSGAADLALNILAHFLPAPDAWHLHQAFKREFVSTLPRQGGVILAKSVRQWIQEQWDAQRSVA